MNRIILKIACASAFAAALIGCGSGGGESATTTGTAPKTATSDNGTPAPAANPMVGTWKLVLSKETLAAAPKGAKPPEMSFTFKDDNTFDGQLEFPGPQGVQKSSASGEYKLDGKKLTITFKMEDGKPSKTPAANVELAEDMKSFPMPGGPPGQPAPGNLVKQ